MPSYCNICTKSHYEAGAGVPCRESGECFVTHLSPDDENEPMTIPAVEKYVALFWEDVVSVSKRERVERQRKKETVILLLPTLEKLEACLLAINWEIAPIKKSELIYLTLVFHRAYLGELSG